MEGWLIFGTVALISIYRLIEADAKIQREREMMRRYDANEFRGRDD